MADFCKACEISLFGKTYSKLDNTELILCEGCGGITIYGKLICKDCHTTIESAVYPETGSLEHYCKCQCTLDAEFNDSKWEELR